MAVILRAARREDAPAIHALVVANLETGHLLPRSLADIRRHASRFVIADGGGEVAGCAELAGLSPRVAEIRSLVVQESLRGRGIGTRLVRHLAARAAAEGYETLCAFTHSPSHFVRLGFTVVPHVALPEKVAHDCATCALFRRCSQSAVRMGLRPGAADSASFSATAQERHAAVRRPAVRQPRPTPAAVAGRDTTADARTADWKEAVLA